MPTFYDVIENSTRIYKAVLKDENDQIVPAASVSSVKLTVYNKHDSAIVNSRDEVNVFNAAGGTLDAGGNFAFEFTPGDTAIVDDTLPYENRVALFELTYGAGTRKMNHEVEFQVRNAVRVP